MNHKSFIEIYRKSFYNHCQNFHQDLKYHNLNLNLKNENLSFYSKYYYLFKIDNFYFNIFEKKFVNFFISQHSRKGFVHFIKFKNLLIIKNKIHLYRIIKIILFE